MIPEVIDFEMREGDNPNSELNALEKTVAEQAFNMVMSSPVYAELGFKRTYNFLHTLKFYMSRDPYIVKLMYKLQPYPDYVEMEVTQKCPLKCIMCEHTYWDEKETVLTLDKFKYAMDQFPRLKWAGNNALGDPFTNPDYHDMVKYVDDMGAVQELYLTSTMLKEKDMKRFVDLKGMVFTKFSVDAATKATYEKIRVNVDFDKVMANVKALDKFKKNAGKHFPEIQFHYIIMKPNIHEAEMFLDTVHSLDVNVTNVTYSRLLHNFPEVKDLFTEIPGDLCNRLVEKGRKLGINVSFNADLPQSKPPANECMAWLMPYIFPDGTVISCCCLPKGSNIYGSNKLIDELKIGDKIVDSNGEEQNVTHIFNRKYTGKMITIKGKGLLPVTFTDEHPITVIKRRKCGKRNCYRINDNCNGCTKKSNKREWKLASEITKNNYLIVPRRNDNEISYIPIRNNKIKINAELSYILGLYLADGYTNKNSIIFTLNYEESNLANKIKLIINKLGINVNINYYKNRGSCIVSFNDKCLANYLRDNFGKECTTKIIPDNIKKLDNEIIKEFIIGYVDGDGYKDGKYWYISTTSKKLTLDIQEMGFKLGVFISILKSAKKGKSLILGREVNTNDAYHMYLNENDLYSKNKRQSNVKYDDNYFYIPIKEIETYNVKDEEVYNIETEDHTFSVPFITHNCMNEQNRRWWQRETRMGNIFEKPFREIWVDKPYTKLRSMLWEKRVKEAHPVCEICNIYDINNLSNIR